MSIKKSLQSSSTSSIIITYRHFQSVLPPLGVEKTCSLAFSPSTPPPSVSQAFPLPILHPQSTHCLTKKRQGPLSPRGRWLHHLRCRRRLRQGLGRWHGQRLRVRQGWRDGRYDVRRRRKEMISEGRRGWGEIGFDGLRWQDAILGIGRLHLMGNWNAA